ncbi:hypothetical protein TSH58p_07160 [Azospirillum sp. TSH58]|uniref:hypothetical protein n=1 Tax=Azospirillum sp. TSH58 TaxID=664962 RepID=UPI000D5FF4CB|nr:hypothetical protein [Azospirillum sp. TSH58]AWJ83324.1 hypothetical protein TSH58p_07160 [Azospirillum sp. TSH58]PWC73075.1 hypothetical protein TSH58_05110 [Azospirillum sp. TSH58]
MITAEQQAALARLAQYNTGEYSPTGNQYGLTGEGGTDANFDLLWRDVVTVAGYLASIGNNINFVTERAAVATLLQRCQDLVAQITMGSTSALAFPAVDKVLFSSASIAATFVYDTRLDDRLPDGSRWNEAGRCSGLSYWSEALGAYTGVKRDVPAVVAISALKEQWYLHDALDLDPVTGVPRLWRASNPTGNGLVLCGPTSPITCVFALNGYVYFGTGMGLHVVSLTSDWCERYDNGGRRRRLGTFAQRNTVLAEGGVIASGALPATAINSVHARVYPGAPLDAAGMPIPTVAVACGVGGAVAVIHPNGTVAVATGLSNCASVYLTDRATVMCEQLGFDAVEIALPYATGTPTVVQRFGAYRTTYGGLPVNFSANAAYIMGHDTIGGRNGGGLTFLARDYGNDAAGMVAYTTTTYATGWMPGDTRLATLCDAATGSITGGVVADRSYKAKPLNIIGTLQRNPVAAGADVVAWSGFGAANYVEQPPNTDLDVGAGDFYHCGWLANLTTGYVLRRGTASTSSPWYRLVYNGSGRFQFDVSDATNTATAVSTSAATSILFVMVWIIRRGAIIEVWVNGVLEATASAASVGSITNAAATLRYGIAQDGTGAMHSGTALTMWRSGAYAPTPALIRKMYADEAPLFQPDAKALLGGASSAVSSLDRDPLTGRLAVGTGDGVSVFSRLRRVSYYDEAVLAATSSDAVRSVALRGGSLLIGTASEVGVVLDATGGKEAIAVGGPRPVGNGFTARGVTTDGMALDLAPRVPVGERETVMIEARFVGRVTGAADTERLTYGRRATYYRDAGGAITLQGAVQTVGSDTEVTGTADATLAIVGDWVAARVTGVASKRIVWSATFTITRISEETSYAA